MAEPTNTTLPIELRRELVPILRYSNYGGPGYAGRLGNETLLIHADINQGNPIYRQAPHHLAPSDWRSGDQAWIVDLFTPFGGAGDVLRDLQSGVLAGKVIHQLGPVSDSLATVIDWPPLSG